MRRGGERVWEWERKAGLKVVAGEGLRGMVVDGR